MFQKSDHFQCVKITEETGTGTKGPSYVRKLEQAIENGHTVLIEDVKENIDPGLDPLITRAVYDEQGVKKIKFGDKSLMFDDAFRLFVTTKLPNPHFMPETCIKMTIVNFTVTFAGLEEQMLVDVVKNEAPKVEEQRDELVIKIAEGKNTLKTLENKILKELAESDNSTILDNENLIENLEDSKIRSAAVAKSLAESEAIEVQINETRFSYKRVSERGSILYFVIADLGGIDPMY